MLSWPGDHCVKGRCGPCRSRAGFVYCTAIEEEICQKKSDVNFLSKILVHVANSFLSGVVIQFCAVASISTPVISEAPCLSAKSHVDISFAMRTTCQDFDWTAVHPSPPPNSKEFPSVNDRPSSQQQPQRIGRNYAVYEPGECSSTDLIKADELGRNLHTGGCICDSCFRGTQLRFSKPVESNSSNDQIKRCDDGFRSRRSFGNIQR